MPELITVGASTKDVFNIFELSSRGPATFAKDVFISKPNTFAPGDDIPGINHLGEKVYKSGSSISTAIVTGFISLVMNIKSDLNNPKLIAMINRSNLPLPNINFGEIIAGIYNPEGMLKLTEYDEEIKGGLLNDIIDFTLDSYGDYSFSNKDNRIDFYSTMQPIYFNLIYVNTEGGYINLNLNHIIQDAEPISNFCVNVK